MNVDVPALHPLTLHFLDRQVEREFRRALLPRLRTHGRVAVLVGTLVFLAFGFLDPYLVPPELLARTWAIRGLTAGLGLITLLGSWHGSYVRWGGFSRVMVGVFGGLALMAICWSLPPQTRHLYYAGLLLVTLFTYTFAGARFTDAVLCNALLLGVYNVLFGPLHPTPSGQLLAENFHLLGANVLGAVAAYLSESQRRRLYAAEQRLLQEKQRLWHDALHDPLTELPNRALVLDRLDQALSLARRTGDQGVVLFLDLDGFKSVNDRFGHAAGDWVLKEAARRMRDCIRASDTLGRMGGDEFVLVSLGVGSAEPCQVLMDKLSQVVSEPYELPTLGQREPEVAVIGASIGHAFFPEGGLDARQLLQRSDEDMYRVKREHRR